jgi:hypothetical protein
MLLSGAALYGVVATPVLGYGRTTVDGARFTPVSLVDRALAIGAGTNLATLRTDALEAALRQLPTVEDAHVAIALPDTIRVALAEREPIFLWLTTAGRFLVDAHGVLFAGADTSPPAAVAGLRVVDDRRVGSTGLTVGATLDPIDLDAAERLGALRPVDLGSTATGLTLSVDDDQGFAMTSVPKGWAATFGFYTPSLRTPGMIPGQVRFLASLFAKVGEGRVATVILASADNGTYTTRDGK